MPRHIHIDIETLGCRPDSVIAAIGAVEVDFAAGVVGKGMHVNIDRDDCEFYGLTVQQETLDWWKGQSKAAKARTFNKETQVSLKAALVELSAFIGEGSEVSAIGPQFDIMILENAYRVVGLAVPWEYWQVQDARTLREWFPEVECPQKPDAAHDALVDATFQAEHMIRVRKYIDGLTSTVNPLRVELRNDMLKGLLAIHNYIEALPRADRPARLSEVMREWAAVKGAGASSYGKLGSSATTLYQGTRAPMVPFDDDDDDEL